ETAAAVSPTSAPRILCVPRNRPSVSARYAPNATASTTATRTTQAPLLIPAQTLAGQECSCPASCSCSEPFDDGGVGQAAGLAHHLQAVAPLALVEHVEQGRRQPRAGSTERVPDRDRATVDVDLRQVGSGLGLPGEHDRGERLVDLERVDVVDAQT